MIAQIIAANMKIDSSAMKTPARKSSERQSSAHKSRS